MAEVTRRRVFGTAAAAAAAGGWGGRQVEDASRAAAASFSYRFRLEAQEPKVYAGGTTREASVRNFPISRGMAGVEPQQSSPHPRLPQVVSSNFGIPPGAIDRFRKRSGFIDPGS